MVPRRMAKSSVERYEQLLAQDPTSSVFVELAKALIAKGEYASAISVCEKGIVHHPQSVTGRVLWGKALILMGRPAEAMAQFDQAAAIDKDNPHAYNLISEVLLQRGLFRSAVPVLRKALALQPHDARVRGWMEQAQAALAGGPAPAFEDLNTLDKPAEEPAAPAPEAPAAAPPEPASAAPQPASEPARAEPVSVEASTPPPPAPEAVKTAPDEVLALDADVLESAPAQPGVVEAEPLGSGEPEDATVINLSPLPSEAFPQPTEALLPFSDEEPLAAAAEEEAEEATTLDLQAAPEAEGGLLGDVPSLGATPPVAEEEPPMEDPAPRATGSRGALLAELPGEQPREEDPFTAEEAPEAPPRPVQDIPALVAVYERELRDKLLSKSSSAFLSTRAWQAIAAVGVVIMLLGGVLIMRAKQGGQALAATLDRASRLLEKDTEPSRKEALELLARVVDLEEKNTRAWALIAQAHAARYVETGAADERTQALAALGHPAVRAEQQVAALLVDVQVSDALSLETLQKSLLAARADSGELHEMAGEVLLAQGKTHEALERLTQALKLSPRNVRALVALGGYYRDAKDPVDALKMYLTAARLAAEHPAARLGVAESRWMLGQELDLALADVEGLEAVMPVPLRERHRLVRGRLMTVRGKAREARSVLAEGIKGPTLAFESLLALGEAQRFSGDMAGAQKAFEEALKLKAHDEDAKAGLGRVLLDRDDERGVLARVEGDGPRVALVRAAAHAKLGDWKRVRAELAHTRVEDRYPTEAIIDLARADVAEGEKDRALEALTKTLAAAKADKAALRTALGLLAWQDKAWDKANTLLEAAVAEDSLGYEAPCALGRLLIARGLPDLAMKPLSQAVERNPSHGEAREALGQALLAQGHTQEALQQFEAWQLESPGAAAAQKGFALALYHAGRIKDADAASARAVKLVVNDAEAQRVRSDVLFAMGDTRGGFSALESANKLDSKAPETFCDIALAFLRQGLVDNSAKAFEAARREGPDAPCGKIGEHWVKDTGGRAAAKTLEEVARQAPTVWDKAFARAAMARVLLASGAVKEAREAAEESVRLEPFSGRAHLALGQVALKQHEEPVALKELSRAVELEPADGLAWLALADALVHQPNETARAVDAYQGFLKLASASPEAGRVKKALPALLRRKAGGK